MMQILLTPVLAFLVYLGLSALISVFGRKLAGPGHPSSLKSSTYSSGNLAPTRFAAPGYRPFFVAALFFAVLHLGALVLGSGLASPAMLIYLLGLMLALLALILG
jgi:NADH:ubiquinone oxidoreductase subunit 3 (subunit A)